MSVFSPLLQSLTSEEFQNILEPVLSRMLKKSPDSLLDAVAMMAKSLQIDLGRYKNNAYNSTIMSHLSVASLKAFLPLFLLLSYDPSRIMFAKTVLPFLVLSLHIVVIQI